MTDDRYRLSAVGYRLSAIGCRLSAVRCRLAVCPESRVAPTAPGFYGLSAFQRGKAATVISSGAACRYGRQTGKCFDDALSREISHRNATRTIRGGDFSTPLRFGRNDGRARAGFFKICARRAPPSPSAAELLSPPERSDAQPVADRRPQPSARRAVNLNPVNPLNPHTVGVSKGKKQK